MTPEINKPHTGRNIARILLGSFLTFTGVGHLTFVRTDSLAQVPPWLPMDPALVVLLSGVVEILLGLALVFVIQQRIKVGWMVAIFFVLVFPGNIAQLVQHRNAFGLDTDLKRWLRLPFQPVLIFVALWSTDAWEQWRRKSSAKHLNT
jgi:uncharacterized membrane protein